MGKKIILFLTFFICLNTTGQEVDRAGLLKGTLTISPGFMLDSKSQPFYFHGILEFHTSDKVSVVGEGSFYLGDLHDNAIFRYNNSLFAGFNWHPLENGPSDLFFGIQPGVSFTMISDQSTDDRLGVNPVGSLNVGYNYFMNEYFHFFLMSKTILGKHSTHKVTSLNEFRISAGLGFSIPVRK